MSISFSVSPSPGRAPEPSFPPSGGAGSGRSRLVRLLAVLALPVLLLACAPRPPPPKSAKTHFREGRSVFRRLEREPPAHVPLYAVVGGDGRILVHVRRAGPLAVLGHNHVVSSRWFTGLVRAGPHPGAVFCLPLANLSIDRPALRRAAGPGFGGVLSPALRRATYRHMLESLRARRHPDLLIFVRPRSSTTGLRSWRLDAVLNGREVPIRRARLRVRRTAERLVVRARFRLFQTAFDFVPYSILAGALRVHDALTVDVHLVARRLRTKGERRALARVWCRRHPPHLGARER